MLDAGIGSEVPQTNKGVAMTRQEACKEYYERTKLLFEIKARISMNLPVKMIINQSFDLEQGKVPYCEIIPQWVKQLFELIDSECKHIMDDVSSRIRE